MSLSKHVDADSLIEAAKDHPHLALVQRAGKGKGRTSRAHHTGAHAGRYRTEPLPKFQLPEKGISGDAAYQLITDELTLDGKPTLNLASFVHTWMPDQATRLVMENISVNLCDQDEYPASLILHGRCISMLADLWNAPKSTDENGKRVAAQGTATTGSSEAIFLGVLAMKKRWQIKRKAEGKPWHEPNLVFGANAQVAIEKAARYQDIEERLVSVSKESHYCLDAKKAIELCDENTIGVVVILGSTYQGSYEPVEEMCKELDAFQKKTGLNIPVHVDGASGAMVAPFAHPSLKWDFQLDRVVSINTSGHKFGMVYAGLGWVIWRSPEFLPKELIFELHYLGSVEYSFGINFSRPAAPVLAQYFNFINLGFQGYRDVMLEDLKNARLLSRALEMSGYYEIVSDIHRPAKVSASKTVGAAVGAVDEEDAEFYEAGLPVVGFKWTDEFMQKNPHLEQRWMQTLLRAKGWIVPNYGLPPALEKVDILRVVVRENLSEDMIDQLVHDILSITESLVEDSAAAHLAKVTAKVQAVDLSGNEAGSTQQGTSTSLGQQAHNLGPGSGTKATGYAKQC